MSDGLRRLLIELLQPLPAEVDVEDLVTGLGSLGMAPWLGATCLGSKRSGAAKVLTHQGKSSTGDERKEDQVDSSQEVVQGWKALPVNLVQRIVNRWPLCPWPISQIPPVLTSKAETRSSGWPAVSADVAAENRQRGMRSSTVPIRIPLLMRLET